MDGCAVGGEGGTWTVRAGQSHWEMDVLTVYVIIHSFLNKCLGDMLLSFFFFFLPVNQNVDYLSNILYFGAEPGIIGPV